jgi:hypothetical protein
MLWSVHDLGARSKIQRKLQHGRSPGKDSRSRAAETRIQRKTTPVENPETRPMIVALLNQRPWQDDARAASRRRIGPGRKARHVDRRRPSRLRARLVRAAIQRGQPKAVRCRRPRPRHAPPGGAGARPRCRSRRHRRAAARRRSDARGAACRGSDADPGAAVALRRVGFGRNPEPDRRTQNLPPPNRRPLRPQCLPTVAEMLRNLLAREFSDGGAAP